VTSVIIRERNLFKEIVDDSNSTLLLSKEREREARGREIKSEQPRPPHDRMGQRRTFITHTICSGVGASVGGVPTTYFSIDPNAERIMSPGSGAQFDADMEDAAQSSVSTNQRELYEGIP
jgi:hypothetical protein